MGQDDKSWERSTTVTVTTVSMLSIYHPYSSLGIGYGISDRWAIEAGVGLVFPFDPLSGSQGRPVGKTDGKGYRFHLEPKLKINPDLFVSTEVYYVAYDYTSERYRTDDLKEVISYDVSSKITGGNLLCGFWHKENDFFFEVSGGIGVKFFTVKNQAPVPIEELSVLYRLSDLFEPEENGNHVRFTIPIDLKIGIVF